MQRDRHGRWMQTKGERTMSIQKAREKRRIFFVGEEQGTWNLSRIASTERREAHMTLENFISVEPAIRPCHEVNPGMACTESDE